VINRLKTPELFLPTCRAEMAARGWDELDILFISGDAYVDHPAFGVPLLARLLESAGYRVGIIAQPDWRNKEAFNGMGRPRLFAAVAAGAMDSMVNHYTAAKKRRNDDAYTPGNRAGARPNRAVIAYVAAIKGVFRGLPVIIGGIEASLRRLAHYDYWDDAVRRSILVDSKADLLLYGMAEFALLEVARRVASGELPAQIHDLRGTAYLTSNPPDNVIHLPSFDQVAVDKKAFGEAFRFAEAEQNPLSGRALAQSHGNRCVVVNPPALPLTAAELDKLYALPFLRRPHSSYCEKIPAYEQIRFSITTHRGCFGGCAFCAIGMHQGKTIQSRSQASVLAEVDTLATALEFRGTISDLGGPSANMYGLSCSDAGAERQCRRPSCLWPQPCPRLNCSDQAATTLLAQAQQRPKVKHLFVASGVRFDLLPQQPAYFQRLIKHHVSGLLKVAPESFAPATLQMMRKAQPDLFSWFLKEFHQLNMGCSKRQGVVPYLMAAHPGTTLTQMIDVALFLVRNKLKVEQVQEFTPTPGTLSTCLYYTGRDPYTGNAIYVPRSREERQMQKALLLWHLPESVPLIRQALRLCQRQKDGDELLARR
jgi:uncharacterized radical SAM protein YgiQ